MIMRRLAGSRYSEVVRAWHDETVAIIGGGSSLTRAQIEAVRGIKSVAINRAYEDAPFADILYFADREWWMDHKDRPAFKAFAGLKVTIENVAQVADASIHLLRQGVAEGLSADPGVLHTGRNSGYQVLNLLLLAGVRKILLLGIDGQRGENGRVHYHSGHKNPTPDAAFELYRLYFASIENEVKARGVRVFNCSPRSAIGFEKLTVEQALVA
jgi:hypothetical protein